MIFAAGRGARLRPLTDYTPKPLLQAGRHSLIERHIIRLAAIGVTDIVVNLHHLAEQIKAALGNGHRFGVALHYLFEPELLETGGGARNALPMLGHAPFILISGDIWTDYPLERFLVPLPTGMLARLIVVRSHLGNDFGFAETVSPGVVAPLVDNAVERLTYASLGVVHPNFYVGAPPGAFPMRELLFPALRAGHLQGERYDGAWFNIGDQHELAALRAWVKTHGD